MNSVTIWRVWLRNPDGETDKILIENANSPMHAKISAVDIYDRLGWYATEARLIQTKRKDDES